MRTVRWVGLLALAVAVSAVVANPVAHSAPPGDGQLAPAAKRLAG